MYTTKWTWALRAGDQVSRMSEGLSVPSTVTLVTGPTVVGSLEDNDPGGCVEPGPVGVAKTHWLDQSPQTVP